MFMPSMLTLPALKRQLNIRRSGRSVGTETLRQSAQQATVKEMSAMSDAAELVPEEVNCFNFLSLLSFLS
jgi:hypothetical protein